MEHFLGAGAVLGIIAFAGLLRHYLTDHPELNKPPPRSKEAIRRIEEHKKKILEILDGGKG